MRNREPNFENVLNILNGKKADRATLFDFDMSVDHLLDGSGGHTHVENDPDNIAWYKTVLKGFAGQGYDYATMAGADVRFSQKTHDKKESVSLNDGIIEDWESYEKFEWPDFDKLDYSRIEKVSPFLQDGQKILVRSPGGVLENVIDIVGFEDLCYLFVDEEELVEELFNQVGQRIYTYFKNIVDMPGVGMCILTDDWGFKTSTMVSSEQLRKYVFPWHKKIVDMVHAAGKPIVLHSCGNLKDVMDGIIDDLGYDMKHSYEDAITPVEEAYELWGDRIAIAGGIDMDFLVRADKEDIYKRSIAMLEKTADKGNYMLGSGNSIAKYIPLENYLAMTQAAFDFNK